MQEIVITPVSNKLIFSRTIKLLLSCTKKVSFCCGFNFQIRFCVLLLILWNRAGKDGVKVSWVQIRQVGRKRGFHFRAGFVMKMCFLKTMARRGALLLQKLRKMRPKNKGYIPPKKQTVAMKESTVVPSPPPQRIEKVTGHLLCMESFRKEI
jgi:hypothetical protein